MLKVESEEKKFTHHITSLFNNGSLGVEWPRPKTNTFRDKTLVAGLSWNIVLIKECH